VDLTKRHPVDDSEEMRQLTKARQALTDITRKDLQRWAKVYAQRDQLVRDAATRGVGVNEITRITGLAKTTVLRILHA
jgi:hypothetical protein